MPSRLSRKDYNLVDDSYDTRVPLHNEEAFQHGINFKAKYIGTLDVPRPTGRMEIVVAMRKIRYEFKAKQIKKRKVNVIVSVEGVKIVLRKRKKKEWTWDEHKLLLMHDPVYRIFYVSHDSHDLKIWSYIARDGNSNIFRCNVFKSTKKSQAMRIVRTIGQAFEVCHKFNNSHVLSTSRGRTTDAHNDRDHSKTNEASVVDVCRERVDYNEDQVEETDIDAVDVEESPQNIHVRRGVTDLDSIKNQINVRSNNMGSSPKNTLYSHMQSKNLPASTHHQMQLMKQKVNQAEQQAKVAVAQVQLLKDQLSAETAARVKAQAQNHQLLLQNRELISQMSELVTQISELELQVARSHINGTSSRNVGKYEKDTNICRVIVDAGTPAPTPVHIPSFAHIHKNSMLDSSLFENTNTSLPNSGPTSPKSVSSTNKQFSSNINHVSVVANDHIHIGEKGRESGQNGNIDSTFEVSSESSSESSSSSDDLSNHQHPATVGLTIQQTPHSVVSTHATIGSSGVSKAELLNLLTFDDTANTSIWTSGLCSPSNSYHKMALPDNTINDESSLFSATSQSLQHTSSKQRNGYTLSPILAQDKNMKKSSTSLQKDKTDHCSNHMKDASSNNPIRWHRVSPSYVASNKNQTVIPLINPPSKSPRSPNSRTSSSVQNHQLAGSFITEDMKLPHTDSSISFLDNLDMNDKSRDSLSTFNPTTPPSQTLFNVESFGESTNTNNSNRKDSSCEFADSFNPTMQEVLNNSTSFHAKSAKLFDMQPAAYERQLRYEPLQKVQAAMWRDAPKKMDDETQCKASKIIPTLKTLPQSCSEEADITVGSILDEIDLPEEQFMNEFWEGDTTESMMTRRLSQTGSDKMNSSDDSDNPHSANIFVPASSSGSCHETKETNSVCLKESELCDSLEETPDTQQPPNSLSLPTTALNENHNKRNNIDHLTSPTNVSDNTPVLMPVLSPTSPSRKYIDNIPITDENEACSSYSFIAGEHSSSVAFTRSDSTNSNLCDKETTPGTEHKNHSDILH